MDEQSGESEYSLVLSLVVCLTTELYQLQLNISTNQNRKK